MKNWFSTALVVVAMLCPYVNVLATPESSDYITFFIDITDPDYEPTVTTGLSGDGVNVKFTQQAIDDLVSGYSFRQFHRAFPNTTDPNLENRFIVEVDAIQLMYDLTDHNSTIFADHEIGDFKQYYVTITDPDYVPSYQLNNYISTVTFAQSALNDIAADYSFTGFYPAFPNSTEPSQLDIYIVQVNEEGFMTRLNNFNSTIFIDITAVIYKRLMVKITDHEYIPYLSQNSFGQKVMNASDPAVQAIFDQYTINQFHQAYPSSSLEHLRQLYFMTCNSTTVVTQLNSFNDAIFPGASEIGNIIPAYTPSDYGHTFASPDDHQRYLDLINAPQAWDITKGDPDVKLGVVDYYTNPNHPDLNGKIISTGTFRNDPKDIFNANLALHGTLVTGTMVGTTDNIVNGDTVGQASIGFNCRASLYSINKDSGDGSRNVLRLANDKVRVINCSWIYGSYPPLPAQCEPGTTNILLNDAYPYAYREDLYNEVYEKGAMVVAAAGNNTTQTQCDRHSFNYPASYPHNISVTSIGSNVARDTATFGDYSIMDEHDESRLSTPIPALVKLNGHNHNRLVDICAPGYTVHGLDYDPNNPSKLYRANATGTSLAAPLVSGTAGLVLSIPKRSCLTPYQIEYILKRSADGSIYNIPANQPYSNPNLLGTGRLDAEAALSFARDSINCNDSATRTMYVEEIKLTHTCYTSPLGGNPIKMSVVVKNGNGNYTYRWRSIGNNTVKINDEYAAEPEVITAGTWMNTNGQYVLYYMVTVTEVGSDIPKIATGRIKVILRDSGVDYAMKDASFDFYNEPNLMDSVDNRNWNFWLSPDLWCRWHLDTPKVTQHQDPEYSPTNPNYIHVRVKNIGCTQPISAGDEKLRVYWTKASTGEIWPGSWTTDNLQGTNGTVPAGREITTSPIDLPILYPGKDTIITIPWTPPNPADYDTGSVQMEVCLLARIIDSSLNEVNGNVFTNVRNNNNIVTRNLFVNDYSANKPSSKHSIDIVNGEGMAEAFTLELLNDKKIHRHYSGDLSEYMYGVLHLNSLYDVWTNGGGLGSGYVLDDQNHTLAFDLATPLVLENLELSAGERHTVYVEFILKDNIEVPYVVRDQLVHLRQSYYNDEEEYQLAGNVSFSINIDKIEPQNKPGRSTGVGNLSTQQLVIAYPNPANSYVLFDYKLPQQAKDMKLIVTNITGQVVSEITISSDNKNGTVRWETANNPSGVYIYKLTDGSTTYDIGKVVLAKY